MDKPQKIPFSEYEHGNYLIERHGHKQILNFDGRYWWQYPAQAISIFDEGLTEELKILRRVPDETPISDWRGITEEEIKAIPNKT